VTDSFRRFLLTFLFSTLLICGGLAWWVKRDNGTAAGPPVYVALGASDAVGVGADRPASESWVPLVHAALPAGTQMVNLGVNGAILDDVVRYQLPVAVDARPRWVTLWPGINDLRAGVTLSAFQANLNTILDGLSPEGQPNATQVIVANIPDLRLIPAFRSYDPATLDAMVRQWNTTIAEAVEQHGATLVNLHDAMAELADHPEYISGDGFHPSTTGYRRIADLTLATIHEHLPSSGR
jgi:lysophospholipase L1-like esterase